jgi:hypothetical protein
MKPLISLLSVTLLFTSGSLVAQDPKPTQKPPSMEDQLKLTKPGPEHEQLAKCVGSWDLTISMGAGPAAMTYKGTAENRMTVGGRFLLLEYQAKGKADSTEGIITLGYDTRHKQHTLIAMDSFGTYWVTSKGVRDEKTGKIRMLGTDDDPMMKKMGYTKEFVHVLDLRSADEFAVEVWFVDTRTEARKEFKYMDYTFTRKK